MSRASYSEAAGRIGRLRVDENPFEDNSQINVVSWLSDGGDRD
jgi:hypothetical protein